MRRITAASLLLFLLITVTLPVPAQTRPRRVQAPDALAEVTSTAAPERPRVLNEGTNTARRDVSYEEPRVSERTRRWPWLLIGAGVSIGLGAIGGRSCAPSRAVLIEQPRVAW